MDYKALEREQSAINDRIAHASSSSATRDAASHVLAIDCSAGSVHVRGDGHELDSRSCVLTLCISWPGSHPLQTAVLCIGCPSPIYVTPSQFTVENLGRDAVELPFHMFNDGSGLVPHSMTIDIAASYITSDGSPGCSSGAFTAPLLMFASPCAATKAAEVSITIGLNKSLPQLPLIFKDICMAQDTATVASSALGLQFPCGDVVSMVASKDGERIRILAPRFDAVMCAVLLLHTRLQLTSHVFSFADPLPLPLYFEIIDSHWAARKALLATSTLLAEASAQ
jgi:Bardet-Biedl syndrome 9 protein